MRFLTVSMLVGAFAAGVSSPVRAEVAVDVNVRAGASLDVSYFHEHLAPHGTWVETTEFGRVWQPTVVVTDTTWRPYLNEGRWISTDAGWYWQSSYAWGWAPFHYGRWSHHAKYNWVWSPDTVWAPAWVGWRHSDSVYGWAPLPIGGRGVDVSVSFGIGNLRAQDYSFVPSRNFLDVRLSTVAVNRNQGDVNYNQTTVVNNTFVNTGSGTQVNNVGIPVAAVAAATKTEIKPVAIAEVKTPGENKADGGKVAVYRPTFKPQVKAAHEERTPVDPNAKTNEPKPIDTSVKPNDPNAKPNDPNAKADPLKPTDPNAKPNEPKPTDPSAKKNEPRATDPRLKADAPRANDPNARTDEPKAKPNDLKPNVPDDADAKPKDPKADAIDEPKANRNDPNRPNPAEPKLNEPRADRPNDSTRNPVEPRQPEPRAKANDNKPADHTEKPGEGRKKGKDERD